MSRKRMPDFIIIGAQKCGTTSLYNYLIQHPQIVSAATKEVHFFDLNFEKGRAWYLAQFPELEQNQDKTITGEASPYYIFHPLVPQRIYQMLPQVKLIVLLRDPVARAISHYYHEVRLGYETLSLEDAIAREPIRLQGEAEKMLADQIQYSFNHQHYSYLARGTYVEQLKAWMSFFPKKQFLILKSEELDSQPSTILRQVLDFLELPDYQLSEYGRYNTGEYPPISQALTRHLTEYFQPYNRQLEQYLGRHFDWK